MTATLSLTFRQPGLGHGTEGSPRVRVCLSGPHKGRRENVQPPHRAAGCLAHCRWTRGRTGDQL